MQHRPEIERKNGKPYQRYFGVTASFRDARVVRLLPFRASQITRPFIATLRTRLWLLSGWGCRGRRLSTD